MIICAAGCLAAAGEALPQAKWPQRAAAALALAPTLPVIVLPIGGLLLLQLRRGGGAAARRFIRLRLLSGVALARDRRNALRHRPGGERRARARRT